MISFSLFIHEMKTNLGDYSRFPSPFVEGEDIGLTRINVEKLFAIDQTDFILDRFYNSESRQ